MTRKTQPFAAAGLAAAGFAAAALGAQGQVCPFTAPTPVDLQGEAFSPTLNEGETEIIFASRRGGGWDLWQACRMHVNARWSTPVLVANVNSTADDYEPTLSLDGSELYFASTRRAGSDIWVSTRPSVTQDFSTPQLLREQQGANINAAGDLDDPSLTTDGLTMFYTSSESGNGDVYVISRPAITALWGSKRAFAAANSGSPDHSPVPDGDGGIVFFASTRPGGAGSSDFYMTWRLPNGSYATPPLSVSCVNTSAWEGNAHIGRSTGRAYVSVGRAPLDPGTLRYGIDERCPAPGDPPHIEGSWFDVSPVFGLRSSELSRIYTMDVSIGAGVVVPIWYDWRPRPAPAGFLFLSLSPPNPSLYACFPGFDGCVLINYASGLIGPVAFPVDQADGSVRTPIPIPNDPGLLGHSASLQLVKVLSTAPLTGSFSHLGQLRFVR